MTISVQKRGQRTVKVEEHRCRDNQSRVASPAREDYRVSQREGSTGGDPNNAFPGRFLKDRLGVPKRRLPVSSQERIPQGHQRPHLSKLSTGYQQSFEKATSQKRPESFSHQVKDGLVGSTEKGEFEPIRQHQSIFTRLGGFKRETSPTSPRTPAQTRRKTSSVLPNHGKSFQASTRTKATTVLVEHSVDIDADDTEEFPGFSISTRSNRDTESLRAHVDKFLMQSSRRNSIEEWAPGRKTEVSERPFKGTQKDEDFSTPKQQVNKLTLESDVSRLSNYSREVFSPLEQGGEGFQKDLQLLDDPLLDSPDQPKSLQEEILVPTGGSGDAGAADACIQLPGSASKVLPKVISTGHKKDQISKKGEVDTGQVVQASLSLPSLPSDIVIPVEKFNQEPVLSWSAEGGPEVGILRQAVPSLTLESESHGRATTLAASEHTSPVSLSGVEKLVCAGKVSEVDSQVVQLVDRGSTTASCSPYGLQLPKSSWVSSELEQQNLLAVVDKSSWDGSEPEQRNLSASVDNSSWNASELEQQNSPAVVNIPSRLQALLGASSFTVVADVYVNGESEFDSSALTLSPPALSTSKGVLLFGENLIPSLDDGIDKSGKPLAAVDKDIIHNSTLPAENQIQLPLSVEPISYSSTVIQSLEKDVSSTLVQTGDEQSSQVGKLSEAERCLLASRDAPKDLNSSRMKDANSIPVKIALEQVAPEELQPVPQEQPVAILRPQKATGSTLKQGSQMVSAVPTHTWRRGASSLTTPANNASPVRIIKASTEASQPVHHRVFGRPSYVRKGNSLVRAPGTATLPSVNDTKATAVISGQGKSLGRKLPVTTPVPFRNTYMAGPPISKSQYSLKRNLVAQAVQSDVPLLPLVRSLNVPKTNNSSMESCPSQASQSEGKSQVGIRALEARSDGSTVSISTHKDQTTRTTSSVEAPVFDRIDDIEGEAGVCALVKESASLSQSIDLTSLSGNLVTRALENPGTANRLYVRRKANQLVVAPVNHANLLSLDAESTQPSKTGNGRGHYVNRKTYQLVRSMSAKGSTSRNFARDSLGSSISSVITGEEGGGSDLISKKMRRGRGYSRLTFFLLEFFVRKFVMLAFCTGMLAEKNCS